MTLKILARKPTTKVSVCLHMVRRQFLTIQIIGLLDLVVGMKSVKGKASIRQKLAAKDITELLTQDDARLLIDLLKLAVSGKAPKYVGYCCHLKHSCTK